MPQLTSEESLVMRSKLYFFSHLHDRDNYHIQDRGMTTTPG